MRAPSSSSSGFIVFKEALFSDRKRKELFSWENISSTTITKPLDYNSQLPAFRRLESTHCHWLQFRFSIVLKRGLTSAYLASSDYHLHGLAIRKARETEIVLSHLEDCGIARALLDSAGRLVGHDRLLKSLVDSVSSGHLVQVSNVLQLTWHSHVGWLQIAKVDPCLP